MRLVLVEYRILLQDPHFKEAIEKRCLFFLLKYCKNDSRGEKIMSQQKAWKILSKIKFRNDLIAISEKPHELILLLAKWLSY